MGLSSKYIGKRKNVPQKWCILRAMKIQNADALGVTQGRKTALAIAEAALHAIDTEAAVRRNIGRDGDAITIAGERYELVPGGRIIVSGIGKCAGVAAQTAEEVLRDAVSGGAVITIGDVPALRRISVYKGTHPFPSEENIRGARALVESLTGLTEKDLVIFFVTGGGSTLLCLPQDRGYEEESMVLRTLMSRGAPIDEINTVRRHLSLARGGHLAKKAYPARVVALVFSDVATDDLRAIASGPMAMDDTTIADAEAVLAKYDVLRTCGIEQCGLIETPKERKYFERVTHHIVVSNEIALEAMAEKARELGYDPAITTRRMEGEAQEVARRTIAELHGAPGGTAFLAGGETTVTIEGAGGRGGRNLEFALAALSDARSGETMLTLATDGRDNGPYAGAVCDIITMQAVADSGLSIEECLKKHDEYPFFEAIGQFLMTGDTGSNVADLVIAIKDTS